MAISARAKMILRRVLITLLILPFFLWGGLTLAVKMTVAKETPWDQVFALVGQGLFGSVICGVTGCEAELLEGMESLVVADSLLNSTPVALEIDEHGRILVAETGRQDQGAEDNRRHDYWLIDDLASQTVDDRRAYYQKWIDAGEIEDADHFTREFDRVVVLEDDDGDGIADRRAELAAWNEMASGLVAGIEAREGSIYVTSIPSVYRIEDRNRDAEAESIEALHTGFGVKTSLIGHDLHGLTWGPDGKLYFSMGDRGYHVTQPNGEVLRPSLGPGRGAVFRMNPDGSELEVFATGVRNPQELAFDDFGNLFTGDNNGDGGDSARLVYLVEGGETGWAMAYQTLAGDYIRGPWVAERLWDLQHETQPAWVLPPVAHIGNGPAGFVHYPGLGLPERYANHFFLCDYAYTPGRSGIWSFALEPSGAGFEMVDRHPFAWSVLATDFDFGWDGRMFASIFDQFGGGQQVVRFEHPESRTAPEIAALSEWAKGKMADRTAAELSSLLAFPDQRLRMRAQFELAARQEVAALGEVARNASADLVSRLHGVWGLGQVGEPGIRALVPEGLGWTRSEPVELRAQVLKVVGEARADWLRGDVRAALTDADPRIQFFAAQALGALGDRESQDELVALLRRNADRDVFLRHAAVWALHRIGDLDAVAELAGDESRSVRLAALLVLRNSDDPGVAGFLTDSDPLIVVEAARAIYDRPIDPAMSALAALADGLSPANSEDLQTGAALHRRVIGANVRLRTEEGARALARYASDERHEKTLRVLALESLGDYSSPPVRDLTMGFYRPLLELEGEVVASVFRALGRGLIDSDLGARAMEIATRIGELSLSDEELLEVVMAAPRATTERVSALSALASRAGEGEEGPVFEQAVERGVAAREPAVRGAARTLLLALDAERGTEALLVAARSAPERLERKQAWRQLGDVDDSRARKLLGEAIEEWDAGTLEAGVALEVLRAAERHGGELRDRAQRLLSPVAGGAGDSLVATRGWATEGGDPKAGEVVFQTTGDCQRCHGGAAGPGGGHGGGVGPSLAGISEKGAPYVLESILSPSAQIAPGFGSVRLSRRDGSTVSGLLRSADAGGMTIDVGGGRSVTVSNEEIESQSEPSSAMPPIGLALSPEDLRDLVAYVLGL